jgi:hypothetical protein
MGKPYRHASRSAEKGNRFVIPVRDRRIKKSLVPDLVANQAEYQVILEDMVQNSGFLIPDPNWLGTEDRSKPAESYDKGKALEFALSEDHYLTKVRGMERLMRAWVGGAEPPSRAEVSEYYHFVKHCDVLDLWPANLKGRADEAVPFARQDLGSLMDLNLLYAFSSSSDRKVTTVLEVGGGYGRLAEAIFNVFGHTVQYVMVDAVPASLYYSRKYLASALPDARIGSYFDMDAEHFDLNRYDIAIVPAWHFERLNTLRYDICINIESMQEMNQSHVDYYLNLFDSVASERATIYSSNAHDYYFRGSFNYPSNWQKLFCANTPRSWTSNHPTEIFRKMSGDYTLQNRACDASHEYRLWLETDTAEIVNRHSVKKLVVPMLAKILRSVTSRIQRIVARVVAGVQLAQKS